jgi:hypothetical protein
MKFRIRSKASGDYWLKRGHGFTSQREEAHIYSCADWPAITDCNKLFSTSGDGYRASPLIILELLPEKDK